MLRCFVSFTKSNLQSQSIKLWPLSIVHWTSAVRLFRDLFLIIVMVWRSFNLHNLIAIALNSNWPGISCIRNHTSRSLLAHCQLCSVESPDIAVGWVCSVAVQVTLYSFLWLFSPTQHKTVIKRQVFLRFNEPWRTAWGDATQ